MFPSHYLVNNFAKMLHIITHLSIMSCIWHSKFRDFMYINPPDFELRDCITKIHHVSFIIYSQLMHRKSLLSGFTTSVVIITIIANPILK